MASKRRLRWLSDETRRNETCAYDSSQKRRSGAFNARASSQNLHPQQRGGKPTDVVMDWRPIATAHATTECEADHFHAPRPGIQFCAVAERLRRRTAGRCGPGRRTIGIRSFWEWPCHYRFVIRRRISLEFERLQHQLVASAVFYGNLLVLE